MPRRLPLAILVAATLVAPVPALAGGVLYQVQAMRGAAGVPAPLQTMVLTVSPDGGHVYALHEDATTASVLAFARAPGDGSLTFVEELAGQSLPIAAAPIVTPDGAHLLVPGPDALVVYARDAGTGKLTFVEQQMDTGGFTGAQTVAVSPDGAHVYAVARTPGAGLAAFSRDGGTGALTPIEVEQDGVGGVDGVTGALDVTVSPDGAHVYVSGGGGVAVFARDGGDGTLAFVALASLAVSNLRVSPDGAHAYASRIDLEVVAFARDGGTGSLSLIEGTPDGSIAAPVAIDPTGAWVHTPISLLARDAATGLLELEDYIVNALGGIVYIGGARAVVLGGADGASVYIAAPFDSALVVLRRRDTLVCQPAPVAPCRTPSLPLASVLVLKDRPNDKDRLIWKWKKGPGATLEQLGNPISTFNDYVLCVYDASTDPQPVLEATVPAGGLWSDVNGKGFRFKDPRSAPVHDGAVNVLLRAGDDLKSRVTLQGKGIHIPMPALPLTGPVTAQVQSASGECWGATYSTPILSDATQYRAKSD